MRLLQMQHDLCTQIALLAITQQGAGSSSAVAAQLAKLQHHLYRAECRKLIRGGSAGSHAATTSAWQVLMPAQDGCICATAPSRCASGRMQ